MSGVQGLRWPGIVLAPSARLARAPPACSLNLGSDNFPEILIGQALRASGRPTGRGSARIEMLSLRQSTAPAMTIWTLAVSATIEFEETLPPWMLMGATTQTMSV